MEIINEDKNGMQLPHEEDIVPKKTPRYIHGASLSSAIVPAVVGATLIAFPAYFQQLPINNVPQSMDVTSGVLFLMGMGLAMLSMFKFKSYSETGGARVDNPVYLERLYQTLDRYDLETISLMACCKQYSNNTKEDIQCYLKKKQALEHDASSSASNKTQGLFYSVTEVAAMEEEGIVIEEKAQKICHQPLRAGQ